jgi:hypothetical protein
VDRVEHDEDEAVGRPPPQAHVPGELGSVREAAHYGADEREVQTVEKGAETESATVNRFRRPAT